MAKLPKAIAKAIKKATTKKAAPRRPSRAKKEVPETPVSHAPLRETFVSHTGGTITNHYRTQ